MSQVGILVGPPHIITMSLETDNQMLALKREQLAEAEEQMRLAGILVFAVGQEIVYKRGKTKGFHVGRVLGVFDSLGVLEVKEIGKRRAYENVAFRNVCSIRKEAKAAGNISDAEDV